MRSVPVRSPRILYAPIPNALPPPSRSFRICSAVWTRSTASTAALTATRRHTPERENNRFLRTATDFPSRLFLLENVIWISINFCLAGCFSENHPVKEFIACLSTFLFVISIGNGVFVIFLYLRKTLAFFLFLW